MTTREQWAYYAGFILNRGHQKIQVLQTRRALPSNSRHHDTSVHLLEAYTAIVEEWHRIWNCFWSHAPSTWSAWRPLLERTLSIEVNPHTVMSEPRHGYTLFQCFLNGRDPSQRPTEVYLPSHIIHAWQMAVWWCSLPCRLECEVRRHHHIQRVLYEMYPRIQVVRELLPYMHLWY